MPKTLHKTNANLITTMTSIINEEDFKVGKLHEWGFAKKDYKLGQDRVDIKLGTVWIEAKQKNEDVYRMLSQIIFTAYRAKLKSIDMPIAFACFNANAAALIENHQAYEIFSHSDINWKQTPSNLDDKTVNRVKFLLQRGNGIKEYKNLDDFGKELKEIEKRQALKLKDITKNNFLIVYNEWLAEVGNLLKNASNYTQDCYLADLMTDGKKTIAEKLTYICKKDDDGFYYKKRITQEMYTDIRIGDEEKYKNFWNKYKRPPKEEYQDYILTRRDLLQSANTREEKGEYFTPQVWCKKSKDYIAQAFGENWQDEYYIWDCACGTGNLTSGLINQGRIFMSTLQAEDISVMNQLKIMPNATHFQFDFLNDDWKPQSQGGKIPNNLWQVLQDQPRKLIIYINPPYLEVTNAKERTKTGKSRDGATTTVLKQQMTEDGLGKASNELFMQFYYRLYTKIKGVKIAAFSTLKNCNAPNFDKWRNMFKAKFCGGFVCRANTFENVKGSFPISFQIWDCAIKEEQKNQLTFNVLSNTGEFETEKTIFVKESKALINSWFVNNNKSVEPLLCEVARNANDFQNQGSISLRLDVKGHYSNKVTAGNIVQALVYNAVRLCIGATWLNDRDQFTKPFAVSSVVNSVASGEVLESFPSPDEQVAERFEFENDEGFIGNCIVFALFEKNFTNWQLFTNEEAGLSGIGRDMTVYNLLFNGRILSAEALALRMCARELYRLYCENFDDYTIGWDEVYKALKNSGDSAVRARFAELWAEFKAAKQDLAESLQFDVYKYGFLSKS